MFFNLDHETKQKILEQYKQNAIDYRKQKEDERKREILAEREFIQSNELLQKEAAERMKQENIRKKNALMEEYQQMLQKTHLAVPGYRFKPKNRDVVINNWGQSKEDNYLPQTKIVNNISGGEKIDYKNYEYKNFSRNKKEKINQSDLNLHEDFYKLNDFEKQKIVIKQNDCMKKFLTDEQNLNEVNNYFLNQKQHKLNFYKDMLYSQHSDAVNKNKEIYGTEDFLILKEKRKKFLPENPYRMKHKYDFGNSDLKNNPILNPQNNIFYNKYFNFYNQGDTTPTVINTNNKPLSGNIINNSRNYSNNIIDNNNRIASANYSINNVINNDPYNKNVNNNYGNNGDLLYQQGKQIVNNVNNNNYNKYGKYNNNNLIDDYKPRQMLKDNRQRNLSQPYFHTPIDLNS